MSVKTRVSVSVKDFVVAWQGSNSVDEASQKVGMKPISCYVRASKIRQELLPDLKVMSLTTESKLTTIASVKKNKTIMDELRELCAGNKTATPETEPEAVITTQDLPAPKTRKNKATVIA